MSEILQSGYQDFRDYVTGGGWDYLAFYDDGKNELFRLSISGDSRLSWSDLDGDRIIQVNATIQGSDSEITTSPATTLEYSALWDAASGGNRKTAIEQFPKAVFNQSGDELQHTHTIEIPDVI